MSIILRLKYQLILILIPLILVFIWFDGGLIIGKGEEGVIFYNPSKILELSKSTWIEVNTGMPNLSWLPRIPAFYLISFLTETLGMAQYIAQAGLLFLLLVTGTISMYYLTLSFLDSNRSKYLLSFICSIFFLLNPFSVSQVWGRGLYPQFFSFALFPLSLLILVHALRTRKYIYIVPLLLSSVVFSWAYGLVTTTICYWLLLGGYFLWWLFISKTNRRNLVFGFVFMFLFFLGWLLVNAFWIMPLFFEGNKVLSSYLSNPDENLGTLRGVSKSYGLDVIVRLLHKGYFFDTSAYSPIYSTFFFQLISFIPLSFLLVGLVKVLKSKELRRLGFFIMLLMVGLFVSLGANPPLGWLFVWVFETITPLQAFRNPFEKFGLVYVLGYSVIFAYGLVSFFEKIKIRSLILALILFLICGIYAWPMWLGLVVAGIDKKIGVKIPQYYEDLNTWLKNNDSQNYRLLMTPLLSGEGAVFQWESSPIYNGVDPMHFIMDQPAISNGAQIPFYFDFSHGIRKYMERENLAPSLSLLRAKFLIDRNDMISVTDREKDQVKALSSVIYLPKGADSELKTICQNIKVNSSLNNVASINCQVSQNGGDLRNVKYLHLKLKTSEQASIEVAVRDNKDIRIRWDGRRDLEYSTNTNDWQYMTIPLSAPTEYNSAIDLSKVVLLEVLAHPKDKPIESVSEIDLAEVKLDPGVQKKINEFKKINQFGNLEVFEPINFNAPDEFGSLSSVERVGDFAQLFEEANKKRDQINKKGFVLVSQNNQKNLDDLWNNNMLQIVAKHKLSDTRYWVKTNRGQNTGLIILSKTFNPQWKIIPGVNKDRISGNFFDDLKLLTRTVLLEDNHFVVNGYANLWKINASSDQFAIVFLPQIYADLGFKISVGSVVTIILIWGAYYINLKIFKNRIKK